MNKILTPFSNGGLRLKNHLVMAPMTRSRALDNLPNALMVHYYGQRTGAGLLITEGTAPTPEALGYPRIPGIFSEQQVKGWQKITSVVHADGSKIFVQLMHTGRIGHQDNLPQGATLVGVSDVKAAGQVYTDTAGLQDYTQPQTLTTSGVAEVIRGYVTAAQNAIRAGFDGVELHGANGYLLEQFLNPAVNNRTDQYGGSLQNRSRFIVELTRAVADAIGPDKVGIRFSPYSTLGDLPPYADDEVHETYRYLTQELNTLGIAYIHIAVNAPIPPRTLDAIRTSFTNTIILCNGLTPETAEAALHDGFADLVAFGRSFLANPDLAERIALRAELNQPDYATLYTPGAQGYTDYPTMMNQPVHQTNMKAIILPNYGPAENLRFLETTAPVPAATDVVVRVKASAVNKLDILKASGAMQAVFPLPLPWIPGIDFAGVIDAVGEQVQDVNVGDEVYGASLFGGANAEYITINPQFMAKKPRSLTFVEAASVPVAALTAWQVVFQDAQLKRGQTILIHGGAGAVGSYAIQFAHQAGANVMVTASADAREYVTGLGASVFIDYQSESFEAVADQVDVVIDLVGGEVQQRSYGLVKAGGYLVSTTQPVSDELAAKHNIHATFAQLQPSQQGLAQIATQLDEGQLRINLGEVFPLAQAADAWHTLLGNSGTSTPKKNGRIVLDHA